MNQLPRELINWAELLEEEFSLSNPPLDDQALSTILGLAGRAAHTVVRPAAPVTTYVLGYLAAQQAAEGTPPDLSALSAQLLEILQAAAPSLQAESANAETDAPRADPG